MSGAPLAHIESSSADNEELDFAIAQERLYDQAVEPLTVRAIIDRIGKKSHSSSATLSPGERAFLARFEAQEDRGAFIEDEFLSQALENGTTLEAYTTYFGEDDADTKREDNNAAKEREVSGWYGLHRFFGMYVVNSTQYGEGQDEYGPFARKKDAKAILDAAFSLNLMPGHTVELENY